MCVRMNRVPKAFACRRLVLGSFFAGCSFLCAAQSDATAIPDSGSYLETGYIATLERTRSPLLAAKEGRELGFPQAVEVQPDKGNLEFSLVFNWHEGGALFEMKKDGSVSRDENWLDADKAQLKILDSDHFEMSAPNHPPRTYAFVGDEERFIAQKALVGKYTDQSGGRFEFGADGVARFPDKIFKYSIVLEQVFDEYDFFQIDGQQSYIAFRWVGADLVLFPVWKSEGPGYGDPDFRHPLARLSPNPPNESRP